MITVALRPGSAIVVPTKPAGSDPTTAAAPAPTPTSEAAPETAPATTSNVRPTTAAPVQNTEPKDPPTHVEDPATKTSQSAAGNANNQWPLPPVNTEVPTTTNALSVLLSAMSSKAEADAAAHSSVGPGEQQHAGTQASDPSGDQPESNDPGGAKQEGGSDGILEQPTDSSESKGSGGAEQQGQSLGNHAQSDGSSGSKDTSGTGNEGGSHDGNSQQSGFDSPNAGTHPGGSINIDDPKDAISPGTPANAGQATVTWVHDGQTFTAISSNGAVIIQGNGAKSTLAAGATATFAGQIIQVPSAVDAIVINGAAVSFTSPAGSANHQSNKDPPTVTFAESGQIFTVAVQGNSLVLKAAGSTTTMAYGAQGTFAGLSVSMPSSPGIDVVNINGKSFTLQDSSDEPGGKKASLQTQLAAVITQDGKTFTAILQSASAVILEAASKILTLPPGAVVTLDGRVFSVPTAGSILVHDGTTITLKPTTVSTNAPGPSNLPSHAGQRLSATDLGSSIIVMLDGSSTITLADGAQTTIGKDTISAASTGGAIVVNGTSTLIASSTPTNDADPPASGDDGNGTEATADTGPGAVSKGSASGGQSRVGMSILLLLGSWIVVVWL